MLSCLNVQSQTPAQEESHMSNYPIDPNGHEKPQGGVPMDDFLSNNVNAFVGDVLLCDSYVPRMFPEIVLGSSHGRSSFSYSPESTHIDQLGFKLSTIFRLGRLATLDVLIKDGSPHSAQMPPVI